MTEATSNKVALVMQEIRRRREIGLIAPESQVSTKTMARVAEDIGQPVSETTFRRIEDEGMTKIRLAILALHSLHPAEET